MSDAAKPDSRFSGLGLRILSALVLAPAMVAIIVAGGWWFMGLMFVAALVSLHEWYGLARGGKYAVLVMLAGLVYLIVCFGAYVGLRFSFDSGAWLALAVVLCVWGSDIGGYFAGKFIGGPKMAPRLSPKKTWAGLAGAMVSSALVLEGLHQAGPHLFRYINTDTGLIVPHTWLPVLLFGALLGLVGQIGDVSISFLKRRAGVKDTGNLIPGHGGLLDRIDALLLVAPVFLIACLAFLP